MAAVATKGQKRASRHDALASWFFLCCGYEPQATPYRGAKQFTRVSLSSVGSKREELFFEDVSKKYLVLKGQPAASPFRLAIQIVGSLERKRSN